MTPAMILFMGLLAWGAVSPGPKVILYVLFASIPFGMLAIVPPEWSAGFSLQASTMATIILIGKVALSEGFFTRFLTNALVYRRVGLLAAFLFVTLITTLFSPRLFRGEIEVVSVNAIQFMQTEILAPSATNISQFIYISVSVMAVFVFVDLFRRLEYRQSALNALCFGAVALIGTAIFDIVSWFAPLDTVRGWFITADYALLFGAEMAGFRRITGLTSEASAFGSTALAMGAALYFLRHAIDDPNIRRVIAPLVAVTTLLLAFFSTSSATYVGLAVFGLIALYEWSLRLNRNMGLRAQASLDTEAVLATTILVAFLGVVAASPQLLDPVVDLIDKAVFQKTSSSSFEERTFWTMKSLEATLQTYGFGLGAGATRTSNGFIGVVAGAGFVGAFFYFAFVARTFLAKPASPDGGLLIKGARFAWIPTFVVSLLVGTSMDFGVMNALLYALAISAAQEMPARRVKSGALGPSYA
ncbi:MAG: hypothetical protein AAF719_01425 [Pseudomonadota bacterium]